MWDLRSHQSGGAATAVTAFPHHPRPSQWVMGHSYCSGWLQHAPMCTTCALCLALHSSGSQLHIVSLHSLDSYLLLLITGALVPSHTAALEPCGFSYVSIHLLLRLLGYLPHCVSATWASPIPFLKSDFQEAYSPSPNSIWAPSMSPGLDTQLTWLWAPYCTWPPCLHS